MTISRYTINIPGSLTCAATSANGGPALNNYFNVSSVATVNVQNDFLRIGSSHTDAGASYSKDLPAGTAGIQMLFRQNIRLGSDSGPYVWFTLKSSNTQAAAYGLLLMYFPNFSSLNPHGAPYGWGDYNNIVFYVYDYATEQYGSKIDTGISRLDTNNINYNFSIDKPITAGNLKITVNDSSFDFADARFTNTYISSISGVPLNMWWNTNYNFDIYSFASSCGGNSATNTAQAPGAPTAVSGNVGDTQVSLAWSAPASAGGASITDYVVQYSSNYGTDWTTFNDGTSTSGSAVVTGLTNGTAYVFRVAAVNSAGQGNYSGNSNSVTPIAPTPGGTGGYLISGGIDPVQDGTYCQVGTLNDKPLYKHTNNNTWFLYYDAFQYGWGIAYSYYPNNYNPANPANSVVNGNSTWLDMVYNSPSNPPSTPPLTGWTGDLYNATITQTTCNG